MLKKLRFSILLILTLITFKVEGQFARSFYASPSNNERTQSMFSYNNELHYVSIKESDSADIRITILKIDYKGETSDYQYFNTTSINGEEFVLSGCAVSGNKLLLAILYKENNSNKIAYLKLNLSSNNIMSQSVFNQNINSGFVRSKQKGDSLITYYSPSSGGIYRLSTSINQQVSPSLEFVTDSLSFFTLGGYYRNYCELLIVGQNEFFSGLGKLFKRNQNGSFQCTPTSLLSTGSTAMTISNIGEIVVLGNPYIFKIDQNFSNPVLVNINNYANYYPEIYYKDQKYYCFSKRNSKDYKYILDQNLQVMDSALIVINGNISGKFQSAGATYLYGIKRQTVTLNLNPQGDTLKNIKSDFVIKDLEAAQIPQFFEYNQNLQFHDFSFSPGHLNSMFFNEADVTAGLALEMNNNSRSLIFAGQNLLVGLNPFGDTIGIATEYSTNEFGFDNELLPGPFTISVLNSNQNIDYYNRGYYVDRELIDEHITAVTNNDPSYQMPFGIEFWPGNGDPTTGQADKLASFVDQNNNGIYEPLFGDYPSIYGDKCFLNVYHQPQGNSFSNSLEVHQYFFMFDCDTNDANNNAFFVLQKFINRSSISLDSVCIGTFIDFDIGNYTDDYIGTNVELGMIYAYNGDLYDESDGGKLGFNDSVPAMGMLLLKGIQKNADTLDNQVGGIKDQSPNGVGFGDGIIDNEYYGLSSSISYHNASIYPYSDSYSLNDFYYSLRGKYVDGSTQQVNNLDVSHSYFGNSDPYFYSSHGFNHGNNYSEITATNPPGDRRIIGGSGPGKLPAYDTVELLTAYVSGIDTINFAYPLGVDNLFDHGAAIRNAYLNNSIGCGKSFDPYVSSVPVILVPEGEIMIFPNPFNSGITIKGLVSEAQAIIFDMNGNQIREFNVANDQLIALNSIMKGVYFIRIVDQDKVYTERIVKM